MIDSFTTWFKSRTAREQLLLSAAAMIILGGGALLVAYQAASSYRASAAADLAAALQMRDDLTRLKSLEGGQASAPLPNSDGSVRGIVVAAASQFGLAPARIEPDGPTGIRTSFEPASAQSVYQWVDAVERGGLVVSRIELVRAGEGDIVQAGATIVSK